MMTSQILKWLFWAPGKFYKYKTSMGQELIIERVIIDRVCCWRFPVNSSADISFIMVVYRENYFWAMRDFFRCDTARGHWEKLTAKQSYFPEGLGLRLEA